MKLTVNENNQNIRDVLIADEIMVRLFKMQYDIVNKAKVKVLLYPNGNIEHTYDAVTVKQIEVINNQIAERINVIRAHMGEYNSTLKVDITNESK